MKGWVCFEDKAIFQATAYRYPQLFEEFETVVLEDWLNELEMDPLAPGLGAEASFIKEQLPEALQSEGHLWAEAIGELRAMGLESPEHADFVFSQLPAEPKNQLLHFVMRRYLEQSPWDTQARLRMLIDQARASLVAPPAPHLAFVRSVFSRPAFSELIDAFKWAPGVESTELLDPFSYRSEDGAERFFGSFFSFREQRVAWISGTAFGRLDRLAEEVSKEWKRKSQRAEIYLACDKAHRSYLKLRLSALGVAYEDFCDPLLSPAWKAVKEVRSWNKSTLLSTIRQNTSLSLSKRLKLEQRVRRVPLSDALDTEWVQGYEAIFADGELTLFFEKLGAKKKKVELEKAEASVGIFPWMGKIESTQSPFCFEQKPAGFSLPSILTPEERQTLQKHGFGLAVSSGRSIRSQRRPKVFVAEAGQLAGLRFRKVKLYGAILKPATTLTEAAPEIIEESKQALSLSATSARTYLECPAKFFFQNVLYLSPAKSPREDIQLYFGVLVHKALEFFFLPKTDAALATETLDSAFQKAYTECIRENSPWLRKEVLETLWNRLKDSIPKLENELNEAFGPRSVYGVEYSFRWDWHGTVLKGRIDRVDRLGNGGLLLLDYKTGSVDFTPGHVAQGKDFQPWFYMNAIEKKGEKPAAFVYYDLKGASVSRGMIHDSAVDKAKQKGFVRGHVLSGDALAANLALAEEKLREVAAGVQARRFEPRPSSSNCQFCDYFAHCRSSSEIERER